MSGKREQIGKENDMLAAYDEFCKTFLMVECTDEYWEKVLDAAGELLKQYPGELMKRLLMKFLDVLEEKGKILKACEGQVIRRYPAVSLPAKDERLLSACYQMLEELRANPELKTIYADVNFYKLIEELEEYRENLRTAAFLFEG